MHAAEKGGEGGGRRVENQICGLCSCEGNGGLEGGCGCGLPVGPRRSYDSTAYMHHPSHRRLWVVGIGGCSVSAALQSRHAPPLPPSICGSSTFSPTTSVHDASCPSSTKPGCSYPLVSVRPPSSPEHQGVVFTPAAFQGMVFQPSRTLSSLSPSFQTQCLRV